jgi:RND family efflux transporter MFP subunit
MIMTRSWNMAALLALALAAPVARSDEPSGTSAEVIVVRRCEIDFERSSLLGTSVMGVVAEVRVKVGDAVTSGQHLGRLLDGEIRAELEIRAAEAESDVAVRLGEARAAMALSKLRRSEKLNRRVIISAEEVEEQRIEAQCRALDVEEAKFKRKVSALQKKLAEAAIRARELVSPFDGEVVALFKQPGESVSINDPVLRVVDSRTMKVTGHLDVVDASRLAKGRRARVYVEIPGADLPIEGKAFEGRVVFVDAQIQRETQTCKVVVEVSNLDGLLRAGMEARIEILPEAPTSPTAGQSSLSRRK